MGLNILDASYAKPDQVSQERYWLTVIIVVAVFLRVAVAFYLGDQIEELPGTFDQISYHTLAQRVLEGYGFSFAEDWWPATRAGEPTAHWSYLYTLYLAIIYGLIGYHPLVARLIQAILAGILMPWLVYRLGRHYFGARAALVAAGLMAIYIYFFYYAASLLTETFYIIAVLWVLDLSSRLGRVPTKSSTSSGLPVPEDNLPNLPGPVSPTINLIVEAALLGLALVLAVLLRQLFLLFIPILFAWLLWRSYRYQVRPVGQMILILIIATLLLILSIVPWTYRNYQAFGQFVLLNTNAGFAFFWGNHPIHGYNFISILPDDGPSYLDLIPAELRNLNEAQLDQALLKRGLAYIQADPIRYLILSFSRIKDYFNFWPSSESGLVSNISRVLSFGVLWPFMVYGVVRYLRRSFSTELLILYLFIAVYTVIHLLTWALIRYRLPIDAVLLTFAGAALLEFYLKLTRRFTKTQRTYAPTPLQPGD